MKFRQIAALTGLMLGSILISGCQDGTEETDTVQEEGTEEENGEVIYGQVVSVTEDSITIEVGTRTEEKPGDMPPESQTEDLAEEAGGNQTENPEEEAGGNQTENPEEEAGGNQTENPEEETEEDQTEDSEEETGENQTEDSTEETGENQTVSGGEGEAAADSQTDATLPETPGESMAQPSLLELTGEEREIAVTEDTEISRQNMGGGMGQPPESEGEEPDAGENPPEAENREDGEKDGEMQDSSLPDGENMETTPAGEDGQPPELPENTEEQEGEAMLLEDLQKGDTVSITLNPDGSAASVSVMTMEEPSGGMSDSQTQGVESYEAVTEYTEDTQVEEESFTSTGTDENAVLISQGASVTLKNVTVTRISPDSQGGDTSSFYGVGAAVLNTDGTTYVSGSSISTDAAGGAGIFSYGSGVTYVADTEISTLADTSGGIHAAGGGTLYAWDLTVETEGESSAAIRSDRGGGTMVVHGGTYTSRGTGSPAVYCTADIAVKDAALTAEGSEAVCIEGRNSLRLFDCSLSGSMADDSQNDCTWNVILYQSMSGDSEVGNSTFEMYGGILTAQNGGLFYTTNTESTIVLENVEIIPADENDFFLRCTGNANERGWGQSGANGADCLFTAIEQVMEGDLVWDSISTLDFYMTEGSSLTGAVIQDETYAAEGGSGTCNLYISEDSSWIVTGDSTLSSLCSEGEITDEQGNPVTIQDNDGTVYVQGSSAYTITTGAYSTSVDLSGASESSDWSGYEVEKPDELA